MATTYQSAPLPGNRLHLHEGPIDLVIWADGEPEAVQEAYRAAERRFDGLLAELVAELPLLRAPLRDALPPLRGPIARRMAEACWPHRAVYITPMAAVAGAVAEAVLAAMTAAAPLTRAYVNDGGDIALHLTPGTSLAIGVVRSLEKAVPEGEVRITHDMPVRGIATSGRHGRSFSLGIADAVTVLARDAPAADAAATLIANAVNIDDPGHRPPPGPRSRSRQRPRRPARDGGCRPAGACADRCRARRRRRPRRGHAPRRLDRSCPAHPRRRMAQHDCHPGACRRDPSIRNAAEQAERWIPAQGPDDVTSSNTSPARPHPPSAPPSCP